MERLETLASGFVTGNRKLFVVTRLQFHLARISNLSKAFKWQKNLHKLLTARSPSCRVNVNCKRFAVSHEKPDAKGLYMYSASRLRQTANMNLYHLTKFPLQLSFSVHYNKNFTKIGRFTPILSARIVLSCFMCSFLIVKIT